MMVATVVHRHMKTDGKIDGFNSGPESDEKWWEMDGLSMLPKVMDSPGTWMVSKKSAEKCWEIDGFSMLQKSDGPPGKIDGFKNDKSMEQS